MYRLCVFAGTADGRQLVERLAGQAEILACAATEYGGELLEEIPGVEVSAQRLDENQMEELFRQRQFDCVIDATHPICGCCGTAACRKGAFLRIPPPRLWKC